MQNWCLTSQKVIPVGGDQLVRIRLDAAKGLCAGAHTKQDKLELFSPILEEFFHVTQDYLHKLCKKFLHLDHPREEGSLAFYKAQISRTNANGNVKARFQAHEEFVRLVMECLLMELRNPTTEQL